jgi:V8-like Glu-specific endopeptidase
MTPGVSAPDFVAAPTTASLISQIAAPQRHHAHIAKRRQGTTHSAQPTGAPAWAGATHRSLVRPFGSMTKVGTMPALLSKVALAAVASLAPFGHGHVKPPSVLTARTLSSPMSGVGFRGFAPIGALMWQGADGRPSGRLCSAAAVHSPGGDLIVTAAHCVRSVRTGRGPMTVAYVPGYHGGAMPFGYWIATKIVSDAAAASGPDPDRDIAFIVVAHAGSAQRLESVTGAERFGAAPAAHGFGVLVGYPDAAADPVACRNRIRYRSATQLEFDCAGFSSGTSGGPLLTNVSRSTGIGTIVGVIGGYEDGGYRSSVSYSPVFGPAVAALYSAACDAG